MFLLAVIVFHFLTLLFTLCGRTHVLKHWTCLFKRVKKILFYML